MTSFCLQIIRKEAVSDQWKVTVLGDISAEQNKWKVVDFISLWKRDQPFILCRSFYEQSDVISQSYKLVDHSKMKQSIKNFNDVLHRSTVLFICINKNFRFRSPLSNVKG